jgi:hypothetical protein
MRKSQNGKKIKRQFIYGDFDINDNIAATLRKACTIILILDEYNAD